MGWGQGTRIRDILDGSSNTLAVSEVLGYDSESDPRGAWVIHIPGSSLFTALWGPNSKVPDRISVCDTNNPPVGVRLHCERAPDDGHLYAAARSAHHGGVVVSTCDGAVHFVSDSVDLTIWRGLATRAGGELVDFSQ